MKKTKNIAIVLCRISRNDAREKKHQIFFRNQPSDLNACS